MEDAEAIIVVGLGFGDEGKGTTVDALARRAGKSLVTRFNGGAQAGHNVIAPDGTWHCFAQFGAGTLAPDSTTYLSPHMWVDIEALEAERSVLTMKIADEPWRRLTVDRQCRVVTPVHKAVGRMRELARGAKRLGSCGMGVGEAVRDAAEGLFVTVAQCATLGQGSPALKKLFDVKARQLAELHAKLDDADEATQLQARIVIDDFERKSDVDNLAQKYYAVFQNRLRTASNWPIFDEASREGRTVIFEGAQGALLDCTRGFVPHVTKTDTTARNAHLLWRQGGGSRPYVLGIARAYGTRHGAGPFVTEGVPKKYRAQLDDTYNPTNGWQGDFRTGWLDVPALRYGIAVNGGVDGLVLTCLDKLAGISRVKVCIGYVDGRGNVTDNVAKLVGKDGKCARRFAKCKPLYKEFRGWSPSIASAQSRSDLPGGARELIDFLESPEGLGVPVDIASVGPKAGHKIFLR